LNQWRRNLEASEISSVLGSLLIEKNLPKGHDTTEIVISLSVERSEDRHRPESRKQIELTQKRHLQRTDGRENLSMGTKKTENEFRLKENSLGKPSLRRAAGRASAKTTIPGPGSKESRRQGEGGWAQKADRPLLLKTSLGKGNDKLLRTRVRNLTKKSARTQKSNYNFDKGEGVARKKLGPISYNPSCGDFRQTRRNRSGTVLSN